MATSKIEDDKGCSKFRRLEDFERMMQEKVRGAFTACLAPIPSCTVSFVDENAMDTVEGGFDNMRAKQKETLRRMEEGVKNYILGKESLMTNDDEDDDTEHDADEVCVDNDDDQDEALSPIPCSDSSEGECLNSIGDSTMADIENRAVECLGGVLGDKNKVWDRTKHLPGSVKHSARSKFDYYRKHRVFGVAALKPISENSNDLEGSSTSDEANTSASKMTTSTMTTPNGGNTVQQTGLNVALDLLKAQHEPDETKLSLASPAARRSELAKQILKRRQLVQPLQHLSIQVEP